MFLCGKTGDLELIFWTRSCFFTNNFQKKSENHIYLFI